MTWSESRLEELAAHHRAGLSYTEIAKKFCADGFQVSRSAVCGKGYRLIQGGQIIPRVSTKSRCYLSTGISANWPEGLRDDLINRYEAGASVAQIAADIGRTEKAVHKKINHLCRLGLCQRRKPCNAKVAKPAAVWTWPWPPATDKTLIGMVLQGMDTVRIAAILHLSVDAVQRRVSAWQKRHELAVRPARSHPEPMVGQDGAPGLTMMELPTTGACKFGTHLPDVSGEARFCGRHAAIGDVWCADHHSHVYQTRQQRRGA